MTTGDISAAFAAAGLPSDDRAVRSAVDTLTLTGYAASDVKRYQAGIAELKDDEVGFTEAFTSSLATSERLRDEIEDLLTTGGAVTRKRYHLDVPFTPGMQYSRRDAARILGWPRSMSSTIYGYKTDRERNVCAIFVTLHKADDVTASTAYGDELLDESTMRWFSRSRRSLASDEVAAIVDGSVDVHVFVKKDDVESDHYYLGRATAHEATETTMPGAAGEPLPVVTMTLRFVEAMSQGLYDYFRPDPGH